MGQGEGGREWGAIAFLREIRGGAIHCDVFINFSNSMALPHSSQLSKSAAAKAQRLQRSILVSASLGIFAISAIIAVASIAPLYQRLKEAEERNLNFAARTRTLIVEEYLSRIKDVTLQIGSRTRARKLLAAYDRGETTRERYVADTRPILNDALAQSAVVKGIVRLDDRGRLAVSVGRAIPERLWVPPDLTKVRVSHPVEIEGWTYTIVGAPIIDPVTDNRLGTDVVLFDVTDLRRIVEDYTGLGETGETVIGAIRGGRSRGVFFPARFHAGPVRGVGSGVTERKYRRSGTASGR